MVLGALAVQMGLGYGYVFSLVAEPMIAELGWTRTQWSSALAPQLPYYAARIEIPDSELTKLDGGRIVPGMQVDTFIKTDERTVMSYLLKPITDRMAHAMRER